MSHLMHLLFYTYDSVSIVEPCVLSLHACCWILILSIIILSVPNILIFIKYLFSDPLIQILHWKDFLCFQLKKSIYQKCITSPWQLKHLKSPLLKTPIYSISCHILGVVFREHWRWWLLFIRFSTCVMCREALGISMSRKSWVPLLKELAN